MAAADIAVVTSKEALRLQLDHRVMERDRVEKSRDKWRMACIGVSLTATFWVAASVGISLENTTLLSILGHMLVGLAITAGFAGVILVATMIITVLVQALTKRF